MGSHHITVWSITPQDNGYTPEEINEILKNANPALAIISASSDTQRSTTALPLTTWCNSRIAWADEIDYILSCTADYRQSQALSEEWLQYYHCD